MMAPQRQATPCGVANSRNCCNAVPRALRLVLQDDKTSINDQTLRRGHNRDADEQRAQARRHTLSRLMYFLPAKIQGGESNKKQSRALRGYLRRLRLKRHDKNAALLSHFFNELDKETRSRRRSVCGLSVPHSRQ